MGTAKGEDRLVHKESTANKEHCAYCIVCHSVTRTRKEFGGTVVEKGKEIEDIQRRDGAPLVSKQGSNFNAFEPLRSRKRRV